MIVFASFVRAIYDPDLLGAWTRHYLDFGFDRYAVFLHDVGGEEVHTGAAQKHLEKNGFEISLAKGEYGNGSLQSETLHDFKLTLKNGDFMVVADSDEFHRMDARCYRDLILSHEAIHGRMIDRWSHDGPAAADPRKSLNHQYPQKTGLWRHLAEEGFLDLSTIPSMPQHKYMAFRAPLDVDMNGCHAVKNEIAPENGNLVLSGRAIDHYTWRKGIIRRLAGKSYFKGAHLAAFADCFGMRPDDEEIIAASEILRERFEKTDAKVMQL
jgi:hypothetical protein